MAKQLLLFIAASACWACGTDTSSSLGSSTADSATLAEGAKALGVQPSPTQALLTELTKDQKVDLSDSAQNEKNARLLPQVLKDQNDAIAKLGH